MTRSGGYAPGAVGSIGVQAQASASCAAILYRSGRILLERRPKLAAVAPNVWSALSGTIGRGESPHAAIARELRSQVGIEVRHASLILARDLHEQDGCQSRSFLFLVREWEGESVGKAGMQRQWLLPKQALARTDLRPVTRDAIGICEANGWWQN